MTRHSITITLDHNEAAVVQDALHAYARSHEGPVVDICDAVGVELSSFTEFKYANQ